MVSCRRMICLGLCLLLLLSCLTGCATLVFPAPSGAAAPEASPTAESAPASPVDSTEAETAEATVPSSEAPAVRGPMPQGGVRWQEVFWDRSLPKDGYLGPDEVAFYLTDEQGAHSVLVMTCDELQERVAALGNLPRTHYFEDLLDERYSILFACYDLAIELGCGMFCFPTRDLRAGDIGDVQFHISYTFSTVSGCPQYTATKDYRDENGQELHYMTAQLTRYDAEDNRKYQEALREARRVLAEMPAGLDELQTAKYLYDYVASTVYYNDNNYYEETDFSMLYDALILHSTVCTGYSEALYCLFNLAGIDCLYLTGSVSVDHVADFHAWNEAKINGKWYIFDATWDSSCMHNDPPVDLLLFFGLSDAISDRLAERKPWPFMVSVAPACNDILDPNNPIVLYTEERRT